MPTAATSPRASGARRLPPARRRAGRPHRPDCAASRRSRIPPRARPRRPSTPPSSTMASRRLAGLFGLVGHQRAFGGHEQQDVGRALRLGSRRHHAGDQRLDRLRSPPLPPGHRGKQGPCGDAGPAGHHRARRCRRDRSRSRHDPVRDGVRQVPLQARARRHPYERGVAACRADRPGRRAAAHRALAQRPDRDRFQALGARRDRRHRRGARRIPARARREGAGARRDRDAGLHPSADRAAGDVRPPSARLCRDGGRATAAASPMRASG